MEYANFAEFRMVDYPKDGQEHHSQIHGRTVNTMARSSASAPNPAIYRGDHFLIPVEHGFDVPQESELDCLVMNICLPPRNSNDECLSPIMVYIHGGSFLFGGANRPVYDGVNFVSHSVQIGAPVIAVNFNYRVGLGGFLASQAIKDDLAKDGHCGVGNFGLTDQQTALEWVQKYMAQLGGDVANVTLYGESAGSMSVDHQLHAARPSIFHRAIQMSGLINTIPTWTLENHQRHYDALLKYLKIDGTKTDALEQLRNTPESMVADATLAVAGVIGATGNPCADGVFHLTTPRFGDITSMPKWLESFMIGDVYHEGIIFHGTIMDDDYDSFYSSMRKFLTEEETTTVFRLYGLTKSTPQQIAQFIFEDMAADALFKTQNWVTAHRSGLDQTYGYHFDQLSTLDNPVKGTAYHALDLLYVFLNMREKMTEEQWSMSQAMATAWIHFAHGKDPWERLHSGDKWMIFRDRSKFGVQTEDEDEPVRHYSHMRAMIDIGIFENFIAAVDEIGTKRALMGIACI